MLSPRGMILDEIHPFHRRRALANKTRLLVWHIGVIQSGTPNDFGLAPMFFFWGTTVALFGRTTFTNDENILPRHWSWKCSHPGAPMVLEPSMENRQRSECWGVGRYWESLQSVLQSVFRSFDFQLQGSVFYFWNFLVNFQPLNWYSIFSQVKPPWAWMIFGFFPVEAAIGSSLGVGRTSTLLCC